MQEPRVVLDGVRTTNGRSASVGALQKYQIDEIDTLVFQLKYFEENPMSTGHRNVKPVIEGSERIIAQWGFTVTTLGPPAMLDAPSNYGMQSGTHMFQRGVVLAGQGGGIKAQYAIQNLNPDDVQRFVTFQVKDGMLTAEDASAILYAAAYECQQRSSDSAPHLKENLQQGAKRLEKLGRDCLDYAESQPQELVQMLDKAVAHLR